MPVNITINGDDAGHALRELRDLSAGMFATATAIPALSAAAGAGAEAPTNTRRPSGRTRQAQADKAAADAGEKANISTGEERVGPQDTPETEQQDAADEAAESKSEEKGEKLTHDHIRAALGAYVKKFGMPAAQEDGPKVLALALGKKPDKDGKPDDTPWVISAIPDTQDALAKVLAGVEEMTAKNPFKRDPVKGK